VRPPVPLRGSDGAGTSRRATDWNSDPGTPNHGATQPPTFLVGPQALAVQELEPPVGVVEEGDSRRAPVRTSVVVPHTKWVGTTSSAVWPTDR
jgi:hypothetical protein